MCIFLSLFCRGKESRIVLDWLKLQKTSLVGIDINCLEVKLIEISTYKGAHCIEGFAKEVLPSGALIANTIKNSHAVSECIQRALEKGNIRSKQAVLALPDSSIFSKVISVNAGLSEREVEEFIKINPEQQIPYSSHEISSDFQIVGRSPSNLAMQAVQIFVSRTEKINERVEAVTRAGLKVKIVDIESHAMARSAKLLVQELAHQKLGNGNADYRVAMINIGDLVTHLLVLEGNTLIFNREEEFGSQPLITALEEDKLKVLPYQWVAGAAAAISLPAELEVLLIQIKRMMQFFFSTNNNPRLDAIIVAGGVARLPGLLSLIQNTMGVITRIANPLRYFNVNNTIDYQALIEISPSLMLACGLALRRILVK